MLDVSCGPEKSNKPALHPGEGRKERTGYSSMSSTYPRPLLFATVTWNLRHLRRIYRLRFRCIIIRLAYKVTYSSLSARKKRQPVLFVRYVRT